MIEANTHIIDADYTFADVETEDNLANRADLLGIGVEVAYLNVNVPSVDLSMKGSFNFLNEKRVSSKSIRYSASFNTRTKRKMLDSFSDQLTANANAYVMTENEGAGDRHIATHFVSSITYGANVVVSFESVFTSEEEKNQIYVSLEASLGIPSIQLTAEARGELDIQDSITESFSNTKVKVYGDIRFQSKIPTTAEEAIEFLRNLPVSSGVDGDNIGVPMDIVLTPLKWINSKAAQLKRRLAGDTLNRLVAVYDNFQVAEARILDTLGQPSGGFLAWRRTVEGVYRNFQIYRAQFSLDLNAAISQFKGGSVNADALLALEELYYSSTNLYNEQNLDSRMEKEEDIIGNLMALASEFKETGVIFAENLREYMAPTFDTRYDRVYAAIIVGMNPNSDREGIAEIRKFVSLAKARHVPGLHEDTDHCIFTTSPDGDQVCLETLKFIAIHFDSFCGDFCNLPFCAKQIGEEDWPLCPTTNSGITDGTCDVDEQTSIELQCTINDYKGKCGEAGFESESRSNDANPFGNCWCACPTSQVIEFVNNAAPQRLTDSMPMKPEAPTIVNITDLPTEADPNNQIAVIHLQPVSSVTTAENHPFNYAIRISSKFIRNTGETTEYLTASRFEFTDNDHETIVVRQLEAGETYQFKIAGMNDVGLGPYSVSDYIKIGHRMPFEILSCVQPMKSDGITCNQPKVHPSRTLPAWLDTYSRIQLTTKAPTRMVRITIHETLSPVHTQIGKSNFSDASEDYPVLGECDMYAPGSFRTDAPINASVTCTFTLKDEYNYVNSILRTKTRNYTDRLLSESNIRPDTMPIVVAVWDDVDVLSAWGNWTLLLPSERTCTNYGPFTYFCPQFYSCVEDCAANCQGLFPTGYTCESSSCQEGQILCPVPFSFRPALYKQEIGLDNEDDSEDCIEAGSDPTAACKADCYATSKHLVFTTKVPNTNTYEDTHICYSPCYVILGHNYESDFVVAPGATREIGCAEGYHNKNAGDLANYPNTFKFTCPDLSSAATNGVSTDDITNYTDGSVWYFDYEKILQLDEEDKSDTKVNMVSTKLECVSCLNGEIYDETLTPPACAEVRPKSLAAVNYVIDGSFMDPENESSFSAGNGIQINYDSRYSADLNGGSLVIVPLNDSPNDASLDYNLMQNIRKQVLKTGDISQNLIVPADSVWTFSIYFYIEKYNFVDVDYLNADIFVNPDSKTSIKVGEIQIVESNSDPEIYSSKDLEIILSEAQAGYDSNWLFASVDHTFTIHLSLKSF